MFWLSCPSFQSEFCDTNRLPYDAVCQVQFVLMVALNRYLQTLLTIEIRTSTMEVVHRLLIGPYRAHVPDEFLHIYLSNCIRSCELIDDRSLQSRQVRLVR